jgi:hypothetical protein
MLPKTYVAYYNYSMQHMFLEGRMEDLIGRQFGRLRVLSTTNQYDKNGRCKIYVNCQCECGKNKKIYLWSLTNGKTNSCGCLQKEVASKTFKKANTKHGLRRHKLYSIWWRMNKRCSGYKNPKSENEINCNKNYHNRGITVCLDWMDFKNFYNWAINNWKSDLTLERLDNNGNYCPENCCFANRFQQNNNTRRNVKVSAFGVCKTFGQWSRDERCKVSYDVLYERITKLKWPAEEAITIPKMTMVAMKNFLKEKENDYKKSDNACSFDS